MSKIYVFDMDGTLIDSMPRFGGAMLSILDEENIPYGDDMLNFITPLGYVNTAKYYQTLGVKGSVEDIVNRMQEKLVYEYTNNIKLKPFVKEYLEGLKGEGASLSVFTASPHIVTDICLKNNGVFHLFDNVWTVDDIGLPKSETACFEKLAARLNCKVRDINFFDDNMIAITTSHKAGCNTYAVYDSQTDEEIESIKQSVGRFIRSFYELM